MIKLQAKNSRRSKESVWGNDNAGDERNRLEYIKKLMFTSEMNSTDSEISTIGM
jgi:hypothetical protein